MFDVILYEPEIPPNTGNVIRLCANTGCRLHLIEPLGFNLEQRQLRRAGLDYADLASVSVHRNLRCCLDMLGDARCFAVETGDLHPYSTASFRPGDALLFGPETRGLPAAILAQVPKANQIGIPMLPGNRSLNLSNAVAVVVYEAWRQLGFGLKG